jgi:hypothetical protein
MISASMRDIKKAKIGRPETTGSGQPVLVRMHKHQLVAIDAWVVAQKDAITRPEAIRRLVDLGLKIRKA